MASRDRKSDSARPPRTPRTPSPARTPSTRRSPGTPPNPRPVARKRGRKSGRVKDALPQNWYTRTDIPPRRGEMSVKLPTDMVICLRGLSRRHGHDVPTMLQGLLFTYLKLTRAEQRRALALEPARAVSEVAAWGGVHDDGTLLPWASPTAERVKDVVNDANRVVRVLVRHVPEAETREW